MTEIIFYDFCFDTILNYYYFFKKVKLIKINKFIF